MKYNNFNGKQVSLLGLGCMRFPLKEDNTVDKEEAIRMIRHAIDSGITYVDTAWMYHDGESEKILGEALKQGYRNKVLLADKMPPWLAHSEEEMQSMFYTQLERLDVDYIDMYLIHNVTRKLWKIAEKYNVLSFLEKLKTEGKIGAIGFSFHDDYDFFEEMIDKFNWDFCQIQLNYMDADFQAGVKGLKLAGKKGIPVVIMEPLKGGRLSGKMPDEVAEILNRLPKKMTPAQWAFKWVSDFPEVLTILSGMSSYEQLCENIATFKDLTCNNMTTEEKEIMSDVAKRFNELIKYDCTKCKYCMPCPEKIDIPRIIGLYNQLFLYDAPGIFAEYQWVKPYTASKCVKCRKCEEHCPQSLPISDIMSYAAEEFDK